MSSNLYAGRVSHYRLAPRRHAFDYRVVFAYLDLTDIEASLAAIPGASASAWSPFRFRRDDHLGDPGEPLDESVRRLILKRHGAWCRGSIYLLTTLGFMAHRFNPVSFYFCYDQGRLAFVVAEVNNTPWGEQHCYVLDARRQPAGRALRFRHGKDFHVSPFLPMDMEYQWRIEPPGESLEVTIATRRQGKTVFSAALDLRRVAPSTGAMARAFLAMPFSTLKTVFAIHWQALKLWLKGTPFYSHPRTGDR